MNWNNINLKSPYERSQNILDGYSFDILLLECEHNIRELTPQAIREHFNDELRNKVNCAREIFEASLPNIYKDAKETREAE